MKQRQRFTIHIIATTGRANYTIRAVDATPVVPAAASPAQWTHTQSKVDLPLDMPLNVVKWKYLWLYEVPTINDDGEEIPYVVRTLPKGKRVPPMPVGPAVMLWLEQVSRSLEASANAGRMTLHELGLHEGGHLVIAPCLAVREIGS
ncbi:MAG: hypothetical protein HC853_18495 [Anaerolineae bacterium]|nr:hypothetical protein [Anaerolineae bacterium]